jgi:RHS repeat-associated protein
MQSRFLRMLGAALASLSLISAEATAQDEPLNKRCLTREQAETEPLFSKCPLLIDEASVSDYSFTAKMWLNGGPSTYVMRWLGQSYFTEFTFTWDEDTGLYDGFCGTYACSIPPGGWVEMEHWEYFVGTLLAENVGEWTYQEVQDGVVAKSRTFEVRELELSALSGADQIGVVDAPLNRPLRLQLSSFEDDGIEDEVIGWELEGPKGAKRATVTGIGSGSETDGEGIDEAFIRLGSKPGTYTLRLNNRRITPASEPSFTFTAIDDIEDTDPVEEHPDFEEGVGENQAQQCDSVGNPVAVSLGNKYQREVDMPTGGISPIGFVRHHNSLGFVSDSFANYWTHTYDRYVEIPADPGIDSVKVVRPDGKKINFTRDGAAYRAFPGIYSTLEQTAEGWRFTSDDLTIENFDADGRLLDITDLKGRVQTASHDAGGRLVRIESNTGGSLDFAYDGSNRLESLTDHAGRSWTYRYDLLGRLEFVDNPDGTTRQYHYEDLRHAYALTGITSETGQRYSWYDYDEQGRATASYHAGEVNRVDIQYEEDGGRIVTDPLGRSTVYQTRIENKRGVLEGISGPVCSEGCGETDVQQSFDEELNITSRTVYGVTTLFGDYDSRGQPGYVIQAAGTPEERRIDYEYDPAFPGAITRITEPSVFAGESKITTRSYDFNGNMVSETITGFDPFGGAVSRTVSHAFDGPFGQISSTDGPRTDVSDITVYEYYPDSESEGNNRALLKAVIDPNGIRVRDQIVYSATGKVLSEIRPNGLELAFEYFAGNDRIKSLTESGGGVLNRTQWEYTPAGDVSRLIIDDETGAEIITRFSYDQARRLRRVDSRVTQEAPFSADQWVQYEFDAAGNIVTETAGSADMPGGDLIIERVFDAYNRIDTISRGGIIENLDYNPDGTLAARTDGNLNTTTYSYDAFKRLTSSDRAGLATTAFDYDTHGQRIAVTDPGDHVTRYWYDDLGNLVKQESPDTGITDWTYNSAGQVLTETDAKGQVTVYSYDASGRMTGIDRAGSDYDISYDFDGCANGVGRLCSVGTGWGHATHYGWNELGELVTLTTNEGQVGFTYGPGEALSSIDYPSGRTVVFDNDSGGVPTQIRLLQPGLPESILVQDIGYSPLARPIGWRFANGLRTSVDLDARHRPISIDVPGVMSWQAGAYAANDNLLALTVADVEHGFGYDALDRLTASTSSGHELSYSYDTIGNRLSRVTDGMIELGTYEPDSNRILSFGDRQYTLDPNGNTTGVSLDMVPDKTYVFSSHNRLLEVIDEESSSSLASYRYDALGQRVGKTTAAETRRFIYGLNGQLLAEMDGDGRILHEFVYLSGQPIVDLFELPPAAPSAAGSEIVIDDPEATVIGANWQIKSSASAVGGSFLQNRKRNDRAVLWHVDQPGFEGGPHDVFVRWLQPEGEGISTVYGVDAAGQPTQHVIVDHSAHELGDWVPLGNFDFAPGDGSPNQFVSLKGFHNDTGFEGTFLEADAVKILPTSIPGGSSEPRFLHGDHFGTPHFVTDLDGTIVWSATYLPFGESTVDQDPDGDGVDYTLNNRFPGQYFDGETGLHYNYLRNYDPTIGRYMEADPIGLEGGVNMFAYAESNPLRYSDVFGLDTEFCQRPFFPFPVPYARHCFVRYSGGGSSSFSGTGPGPDPAPDWWPRNCQPTEGEQDDVCMRREMQNCEAAQYDFLGFNCCHCVERAMNICGISIPRVDWPNWPVNPGPRPWGVGYPPDPQAIGRKP